VGGRDGLGLGVVKMREGYGAGLVGALRAMRTNYFTVEIYVGRYETDCKLMLI
jgi:hypothetical protein